MAGPFNYEEPLIRWLGHSTMREAVAAASGKLPGCIFAEPGPGQGAEQQPLPLQLPLLSASSVDPALAC